MKTRKTAVCFAVILVTLFASAQQKTIESLKGDAERATGGQQAKLCARVADALVGIAGQQFTDGNDQAAQATVQEILTYASRARDIAIKTHGKMKETEIVLRDTQRKLAGLKRTLGVDDRPPIEQVEKKIEQFRQDVLNEMFAPPKQKESK
jgi:hypothetical protein